MRSQSALGSRCGWSRCRCGSRRSHASHTGRGSDPHGHGDLRNARAGGCEQVREQRCPEKPRLRDSLVPNFPFLTLSNSTRSGQLALCLPAGAPSSSYWYAGFQVPPGPTSRDATHVTRPFARRQRVQCRCTQNQTNGAPRTTGGRVRRRSGIGLLMPGDQRTLAILSGTTSALRCSLSALSMDEHLYATYTH